MADRSDRIPGDVAVVTGAARGLGRAVATALASDGYDLVLVDIGADLPAVGYPMGTREQLRATAASCRAYGACVETVVGDLRAEQTADEAAACARERFGRVDVLVNGAGLAGPSGKVVYEMTAAEWSLVLEVNLTAVWRMIRSVAPTMVEQRRGSIVNISSTAGVVGYRHFASYVAAKHGLIGLTKAAALDLAPYGVRVNAVSPGSIRDDPELDGRMLAAIADYLSVPVATYETVFRQQQPTNALVEAEDVASAVAWLAGDGSRSTTGATIVVDGGFTAR
jgi:NAD(P)-dependent dehydrogenase (short-subunit alcohol dehydrogenase family)